MTSTWTSPARVAARPTRRADEKAPPERGGAVMPRRRLPIRVLSAAAVVFLLSAGIAPAQITRIDLPVVESPALGGESYGAAGRYERLRGTVTGEVDPDDPRHRTSSTSTAPPATTGAGSSTAPPSRSTGPST